MEESRNTGQIHTHRTVTRTFMVPACDRGNCGGGMARVRPQPSSHVHEGLHQRLNHRILDWKVRLVHPSHVAVKNMGLSKFRWLTSGTNKLYRNQIRK